MNSHPDTETLSAFLDGEAPEVASHVGACGECRQRLDALSHARSAVATPVAPPDASRRDAAIAAAVHAASSGQGATPSGRWKVIAVAGAVAAAIVIGVVITRASTSHKASTTALGKAGPVSTNLVRGGDLGNVDDSLALRARVEPSLQPAPTPKVEPASPGGAGARCSLSCARSWPSAGWAGPSGRRSARALTSPATCRVSVGWRWCSPPLVPRSGREALEDE